MNKDDFFSLDKDTIDLSGIDAIMQLARYRPNELEVFLEGMELAEDLTTSSGTLYTKGTEISPDRIIRLLRLRESNPKMELLFKVKRSPKLIRTFRNEIKEEMTEIFKHRKETKVFRGLLSQIGENIESFIDEILSEENITLTMYKMKFMCDSAKNKKSTLFYNHSLNIVLFTLALARSEKYADVTGNDTEKLLEICKVALFHNFGALTGIDKILKAPEEDWFELYWDANRNGYLSLENLKLSSDVMESIRFLCEYNMGVKDFITGSEWPATMANIVLVADTFLQKESGLFDIPQLGSDVVDQMNVLVKENAFNKLAVEVLTIGLNLKEIFDFYQVLSSLANQCPYNFSGVPYPLTGFKSPTLYICKDNVMQCEHIEKSLFSVKLVKPMGVLKPGKYHRCWLLTPKLNAFYKKYHWEMKKPKDTK